jgi:hypothetical protein
MRAAYLAAGSRKKDASLFFNCVSEFLLLIDEKDLHTPIELLIFPPALHLKLGFCSILRALRQVWGEGLLNFLSHLHIDVEPYHGGEAKMSLEGNQIETVFLHLEELLILLPAHLALYGDFMLAFRWLYEIMLFDSGLIIHFRRLVDSCLRMSLAPDWEEAITNFGNILDRMVQEHTIVETVKFHILRVSGKYSTANYYSQTTIRDCKLLFVIPRSGARGLGDQGDREAARAVRRAGAGGAPPGLEGHVGRALHGEENRPSLVSGAPEQLRSRL